MIYSLLLSVWYFAAKLGGSECGTRRRSCDLCNIISGWMPFDWNEGNLPYTNNISCDKDRNTGELLNLCFASVGTVTGLCKQSLILGTGQDSIQISSEIEMFPYQICTGASWFGGAPHLVMKLRMCAAIGISELLHASSHEHFCRSYCCIWSHMYVHLYCDIWTLDIWNLSSVTSLFISFTLLKKLIALSFCHVQQLYYELEFTAWNNYYLW
jgi:hypothetical protein